MRRAWVLVLAACGGSTPKTQPPPATTAAHGEPKPADICSRFLSLRDAHCGDFSHIEMDPATCTDTLRKAQSMPPTSARLAIRQLGRCAVDNERCADAQACGAKIDYFQVRNRQQPPAETVCQHALGPLAKCGFHYGKSQDECVQLFGENQRVLATSGHCFIENDACDGVLSCVQDSVFDPHDLRACSEVDQDKGVGLGQADYAKRKGAGVTRYAQAHSTKDAPIEACGFKSENQWLFTASCNDGSHPIQNRDQAEAVRKGNLGGGGRCGSIVDQYFVKCPEATYEIDIDAYVCPFLD